MSENPVDNINHFGYYGKLPITGDFINRDLSHHFVHRWDNWLHDNLSFYKQHYQDAWLQYYLNSPVWRFLLLPSTIDNNAYIGIMGPSVDSVGRYFPMTIAAPVKVRQISPLFSPAFQTVYSELEGVFFQYLNSTQNASVASFHQELQDISTTFQQLLNAIQADPLPGSLDSHRFVISDQSDIAGAVSSLWLMQLVETHAGKTLWWSNGSNSIEPSILVNNSLPDKHQFIEMFSAFRGNEHWREKQLIIPLKLSSNQTAIENSSKEITSPLRHTDTAQIHNIENHDLSADTIPDANDSLSENHWTPPAEKIRHTANDSTPANYSKKTNNDTTTNNPTDFYNTSLDSDLGSTNDELLDLFLDTESLIVDTTMSDQNCAAPQESEKTAVNIENNMHVNPISRSYGFSEVGHVRTLNEDAILIHDSQLLWVVADGMGGHSAGDKASQMITEHLQTITLQGDLSANIEQIKTALNYVNEKILSFARSQHTTCGSTVVVLLQNQQQCAYLWAGDSRLYLFRNNELLQLTTDHSLQNELAGIDSKTARSASNVITRAVGVHDSLDIESGFLSLKAGDRFLLCSDGLHGPLTEQTIKQGMLSTEPETAGTYLKEAVLDGSARDNLSGILVWF